MKNNRGIISIVAVLLVLIAVSSVILGCLIVQKVMRDERRSAEVYEEDVKEEDDEPEADEEKEKESELGKEDGEIKEEQEEWVYGYREFLSNHENFLEILKSTNTYGKIIGFYLHDLDGDATPELLIRTYIPNTGTGSDNYTYIYGYENGAVTLKCNLEVYNNATQYVMGYDKRDHKIYHITLDAGTSPTRDSYIYEFIMPRQSNVAGSEDCFILVDGSVFGSIMNTDEYGNTEYQGISWEESISGKFKDIVDHFSVFVFHDITQENIEQKVVNNYQLYNEERDFRKYAAELEEEVRSEFLNGKEINVDEYYQLIYNTFYVDFLSSNAEMYIDLDHLDVFPKSLIKITETDTVDSDNYKDIYKNIVAKDNLNNSANTYDLIYLDGDDIPELVITTPYSAWTGDIVYTIRDGKPEQLILYDIEGKQDDWSSDGLSIIGMQAHRVWYYEYSGIFCTTHGQMSFYYEEYFLMNGARADLVMQYSESPASLTGEAPYTIEFGFRKKDGQWLHEVVGKYENYDGFTEEECFEKYGIYNIYSMNKEKKMINSYSLYEILEKLR